MYMQRTYPSITPHVKGLHLTIYAWRPHRNAEGWKAKKESVKPSDSTLGEFRVNPPARVVPVPRLKGDMQNLLRLFGAKDPPF